MSRLHHPKAGFWIRLCVAVIYPFVGLLFKIRWRHLDRITPPSQGGVIIAINHISMLDTLLMARLVWQSGRVPRFLIKSGIFHTVGVGTIMRGAKQIPVYRGTKDASESLKDAVSALRDGEAIVIYPEGTVTSDPDGWPMQARTGIARLVLLSPATPVVPVGQWGAQRRRSQPWYTKLGRRRATASVGEPMDLSHYAGREPDAETLREITDLVMDRVRAEVALVRQEAAPRHFHVPLHKYVDKVRRKAG